MKTFTIDIHPELTNVTFTVKNGRKFSDSLIAGSYDNFYITPATEEDAKRISAFAVKHADDKSSNRGNWYAHCNGFAMDLTVTHAGTEFMINTWRPFGRMAKN